MWGLGILGTREIGKQSIMGTRKEEETRKARGSRQSGESATGNLGKLEN